MANEGEFPKEDGDVFYGKDANIVKYSGYNSNTILYDSVSVGSDATMIVSADTTRKSLLVRNHGSTVIFVGPSGVTNSNGYKIQPKQSIYLNTVGAVYAAADSSIGSGTNDTRYMVVR